MPLGCLNNANLLATTSPFNLNGMSFVVVSVEPVKLLQEALALAILLSIMKQPALNILASTLLTESSTRTLPRTIIPSDGKVSLLEPFAPYTIPLPLELLERIVKFPSTIISPAPPVTVSLSSVRLPLWY